jgi:hypothetical protein
MPYLPVSYNGHSSSIQKLIVHQNICDTAAVINLGRIGEI